MFGIVRLDQGAEHLLRALGRGEMRDGLGEEVLQVLHPARRATGELGQHRRRVLLDQRAIQAEQQLHALFHDRQVGGEIGVEHAVETAAPQGRVHLEREGVARLQSKTLADPGPRTGRGLDHDVLGRVVDGLPHVVGQVVGPQGAGRAAVDALPAVDAHHVGQRLVHEGADLGVVAAVQGLQHAHLLQVDAGPHAAAAKDALVHVADHGVARGVDRVPRLGHVAEAEKVHAIFRGQRLEFAVAVAACRRNTRHRWLAKSRSRTWRRARRTLAVWVVTRMGDVIG